MLDNVVPLWVWSCCSSEWWRCGVCLDRFWRLMNLHKLLCWMIISVIFIKYLTLSVLRLTFVWICGCNLLIECKLIESSLTIDIFFVFTVFINITLNHQLHKHIYIAKYLWNSWNSRQIEWKSEFSGNYLQVETDFRIRIKSFFFRTKSETDNNKSSE